MPYVPGSSLKGVLRSRVEYLCRVLGHPACEDADCGTCQPCLLFGWSPRGGGDVRMGARAAVAIPDAVIHGAGEPDVRTHVALDRVTGGARPALLYAQQVVVTGRFRLRVEPLRTITEAERALLRVCVADLDDGLVGIGAATTRGLGTVRSATTPGLPRMSPRWLHSSPEDPMAEQMSLYGSGPRTSAEWPDLVASLPHATAVWADLEGMHRAATRLGTGRRDAPVVLARRTIRAGSDRRAALGRRGTRRASGCRTGLLRCASRGRRRG
ncbi:MAG: RAMP superfamily CRISPR-associated protein [Actinomycetota bacterium]|nr:RAMP superfamily CRISPR-associated protein [Actinomycetota bacterium]